jgi:hypothetical protein
MSNPCLGGDDEQENMINEDTTNMDNLYIYVPFFLTQSSLRNAEIIKSILVIPQGSSQVSVKLYQ